MKKHAFLICNPKLASVKPDLQGVENDVTEWKKFLKSIEGGCWTDEDISVWPAKRKDDLLCDIKGLKPKDGLFEYVLFFFAGHGAYDVNGNDMIYPHENRSEAVYINNIISELKLISKKAVIIIDACRCPCGVESHNSFNYTQQKQEMGFVYESTQQSKPFESIADTYDFWVYIANDDFVLVQSCQKDHVSGEGVHEGDATHFGCFTRTLLDVGYSAQKITYFDDAVAKTNEIMKDIVDWKGEDPQVAEISKKNSRIPFTFGKEYLSELKKSII